MVRAHVFGSEGRGFDAGWGHYQKEHGNAKRRHARDESDSRTGPEDKRVTRDEEESRLDGGDAEVGTTRPGR